MDEVKLQLEAAEYTRQGRHTYRSLLLILFKILCKTILKCGVEQEKHS